MRNIPRDQHTGFQVTAAQPCNGMRLDTRSTEGQTIELEHFGPDNVILTGVVIYLHEGVYFQCLGIELPDSEGERRKLLDCKIVLFVKAV